MELKNAIEKNDGTTAIFAINPEFYKTKKIENIGWFKDVKWKPIKWGDVFWNDELYLIEGQKIPKEKLTWFIDILKVITSVDIEIEDEMLEVYVNPKEKFHPVLFTHDKIGCIIAPKSEKKCQN